MKNYYAVLGLPLTASMEDIKVAYRQYAKKYHPDLNQGYENLRQRFIEINEAYDILSVPEKKKEYDAKIAAYKRARAAQKQAAQAQAKAQSQHPYQNVRQQEAPRPASAPHHAYQQKPQYDVPKHTPPNSSASESSAADDSVFSAVKSYSDKKLREIKKTYDMRVKVLQKNNKTELRELRKRLLAQIDAHKKYSDIKLKRLSEKYKQNLERAREEAKHYKENYKKRSFNAGMEIGFEEAYNDGKKTISELQTIIDTVNGDLEKLRLEKQTLEEKYIKAKENDDGIGAADLIKVHREKMEIETELMKTKNTLRALEIKLAQTESQHRKLEAEAELIKSSSENTTQLGTKEKKALENRLAKALEEIGSLEEDIRAGNILLKEKDREIYDLKDEISELHRSLKILGVADKTKESEDAEAAKFESEQRERAKGTLYELLGLPLTALHDEIEWAFDSLSKQLKGKKDLVDHYIKIIEAYNILSDEDAKAEYDESINNTTEL